MQAQFVHFSMPDCFACLSYFFFKNTGKHSVTLTYITLPEIQPFNISTQNSHTYVYPARQHWSAGAVSVKRTGERRNERRTSECYLERSLTAIGSNWWEGWHQHKVPCRRPCGGNKGPILPSVRGQPSAARLGMWATNCFGSVSHCVHFKQSPAASRCHSIEKRDASVAAACC